MDASPKAIEKPKLFKIEPGSPTPFDSRGSDIRNLDSEPDGTPMEYVSSSSSDEMEEQVIDIHKNEGIAAIRQSRRSPVRELQRPFSSDGVFQMKQEAEIYPDRNSLPDQNSLPDRNSLHENEKAANDLLHTQPVLDNLQLPRQADTFRKAQHAQPVSRHTAYDVSYDAIPDYAPPLSSLPVGNSNIFQVDWPKKSFANLSKDPDRHMLHVAELKLAATLDLSCAKYLNVKRRIFEARFRALQAGIGFKRVDARRASKINNLTVSKMCRAWEKVGWFDEKFFLGHLKGSDNSLGSSNGERKDMNGPSSNLTKLDIWDVSESEVSTTSEEDEESTDEDTADLSNSFDGRHDETEGQQRNVNSHPEILMGVQSHGGSFIEEDGSEPRVFSDRTDQISDSVSRKATTVADPTTEDGRPSREAISEETASYGGPGGLSGDYTDEVPLLETRSMTRRFELVRNSDSGADSTNLATGEATDVQQPSSQEKLSSPLVQTGRILRRVPGIPIPHTLAEAIAADTMLVRMREESRPWDEIEEAWVRQSSDILRSPGFCLM